MERLESTNGAKVLVPSLEDGPFSKGGTETVDGMDGVTYLAGAQAETHWQGTKEGPTGR